MQNSQPPEPRPELIVDWDVAEELEERVNRAFLERVLAEALKGRRPFSPLEVGLTITTDEEIRELNRRYRDVDSPTDVLSFPMLDYDGPERPVALFPSAPGEPTSIGDIVISYPRAMEQAAAYGHSPERETAFLLVHGVMHLLGYDHEDPGDEEAMRREEEAVLERLGLTR